MERGARRHGRAGAWKRRALAWRLLAATALFGCGASESDDAGGARGVQTPDRISGGQTGSLIPTCGPAPAAALAGVPASSAGIVVYTRGCTAGAEPELVLYDAAGRPLAAARSMLDADAYLLTPMGDLTPGRYLVGPAPRDAGVVDEDAGLDADAGVEGASASAPPSGRPIDVTEVAVLPTRLGTLASSGTCSGQLQLSLEAALKPFAGQLALDLRVDGGAPARVVPFGTLDLKQDPIPIAVPESVLERLSVGPHSVTLTAVLAGMDVMITPAVATIGEACVTQATPTTYDESYDRDSSDGCSAGRVRAGIDRGGGGAAWPLALLALVRRRRRRRRRASG